MHTLRDDPAFVKQLNFVMEKDGKLIGQNMFMRTIIKADNGEEIPVLTMGPICITPELKRKGYGKKLLDYSLEKAKELGLKPLCRIIGMGTAGNGYTRLEFSIPSRGLIGFRNDSLSINSPSRTGIKSIYSSTSSFFKGIFES